MQIADVHKSILETEDADDADDGNSSSETGDICVSAVDSKSTRSRPLSRKHASKKWMSRSKSAVQRRRHIEELQFDNRHRNEKEKIMESSYERRLELSNQLIEAEQDPGKKASQEQKRSELLKEYMAWLADRPRRLPLK